MTAEAAEAVADVASAESRATARARSTPEDSAQRAADQQSWLGLRELRHCLASYRARECPARPRALDDWTRADVVNAIRQARAEGKPGDALKAWSEWREQVTYTEASNAGRLQCVLLGVRTARILAGRYPETRQIADLVVELERWLLAHWGVQHCPDDAGEIRTLAERTARRLDVLPGELRNPEVP